MQQYKHFIQSQTKLGSNRIRCPECSHTRRKKTERCMSVTVYDDRTTYQCHHCDLSGAFSHTEREYKPVNIKKLEPKAEIGYLKSRKISQATINKYKVFEQDKFFPSVSREMPSIGFPYHNEGEVYAVKYRAIGDKTFVQEGVGGAKTFFGIEYINPENKTLIICEGEMDALTLDTCGFENVVSVPNGASNKLKQGQIDPSEDRKFQYVWNGIDVLNGMDKIILATDNDPQGHALREELARRCGKAKIWTVDWADGCKDANDVLMKHGKKLVRSNLEESSPYPIAGLYSVDEYEAQVQAIYDGGTLAGESTALRI